MKHKNYGGKQLGRPGGYGVAFIPALKCDSINLNIKGTIGKLFYIKEDADDAWNIIEKLRHIDSKQKFLLYSSERCEVFRDTAISQEPSLVKILEDHKVTSTIKFQQHIMKHGGVTLKHYLLENYSKINKIGRAELIYLIQNLFYAVKKLQDNSFVHQDIKLANIVISNKNRLRLIDFDLLFNNNEFYNVQNIKIRELYNGIINEDEDKIEEKYNTYINTNIYNENHILRDGDYHYVSAPEYNLFSQYMKFLVKKNKRFIPHFNAEDIIEYTITQKNYYEGDMSKFYDYLGLNNQTHKDNIVEFIQDIKKEVQKPTINPLKDFWMKNKIEFKSDVFSIGLILLRICTLSNDIFKDPNDESTKTINYIDEKNGPRVVKSPTSNSKQINVVDAFNILMRGLLWANPKNRFTIKKALAWVKLICEFVEVNPFTKNKDNAVLMKDMKSKSSSNKLHKSIEQEEIEMWFKELNKTPIKKSRFTIISTSHKY